MKRAFLEEIWRPVPGFPNVEASNEGRIRTTTRVISVVASSYRPAYQKTVESRILNQWANKGRCSVAFEGFKGNVGRIICLAFHGEPPPGKPNALHRDDDSWNNTPDNLYWGTPKENSGDAIRHNLIPHGERTVMAKLTDAQALAIKIRRLAGERGVDLAREFGVSQQTVNNILTGYTWGWLEIPPTTTVT